MIRRLPLLALPLLLVACATPTQPTVSSQLQTLYDYRLSSEGDADLTLEQAIARIADADIILVGELHSHPAVHLLQSRLLSGLYTAGANSTPKCNTRQIKQPVVVHQTRSAVA
ncbi:hypothetical protein LOS88_04820 [Aeromonas veronii]|nr:hypothetical protein [Aeromonas veronii]UOR20001.1 hypothetical protein LOS88_04820 [Aeromonas veronii]